MAGHRNTLAYTDALADFSVAGTRDNGRPSAKPISIKKCTKQASVVAVAAYA